jgi:hypothetical protein
MHTPNQNTYRPWLGEEVNRALFILVEHRNSKALSPLSVSDYIEKMVASWWKREFPDAPVPFQCKRYDDDLDL